MKFLIRRIEIILKVNFYTSKSSPLEVFCKKGVKCFNFIKKVTLTQVFSCEFCEIFDLRCLLVYYLHIMQIFLIQIIFAFDFFTFFFLCYIFYRGATCVTCKLYHILQRKQQENCQFLGPTLWCQVNVPPLVNF